MIQLGIIVAYLALLLGLGLLANRLFRGTAEDYMLASHTIGPFLLLMSLFGTTMTAFALVGSTGRAFTSGVGVYGQLASASGIVHSLCFFLIGVPLWRLGKRYGYSTQIQFFRERLENNAIGLLLFPILVVLVISYLLLGVVAAGAVVNTLTVGAFRSLGWFAERGYGLPAPMASAIICMVVLTYVFFGGMRGTAWANTFQTLVFMVLGVLTFVTVANALGGTNSLWQNMKIALSDVPIEQLSRETKVPKSVYFSFLLIPLSVGMFPHVFQHWLTARSAKSFRLAIVMHPIFIMIVWVPCVLLGIWASGANSGVPAGTSENRVLAMLVQEHAGPVLGGLLAAGILAAIMSSLDSQFLCLGTIFTEDVVVHYYGKGRFSEKQIVLMARLFVLATVVVTYVLSLFPRAVFDLGIWSFSGFTGLVPLVLAAIYWRRLTAAGAVCSVFATAVTWTALFWRADWGMD
ncbi:MAG: sodium:solute symporter family protein, partial [Planctomycetes bacterium]|nr:sodium:solute symporter family protein [Planctomycetota bacterium]